jgi:hypothetical protein
MRIQRIDETLEACERHLTDTKAIGTEIESYLTRYALVAICAAFEEEIEKLIIKRAEIANDIYLTNLVRSCVAAVFRSVKTSEIAGLIGRFDAKYKETFQEKMKKNQQAETFFNNIVINRHDTAHKSGSKITFKELVKYYEMGHIVIDAIEEVLFNK